MRIKLTVLFCLLIVLVKAQDRSYYDSLTYQQFISGAYKPLLKTGREALSKGVDFYYLRYRMAFAAFECKKYLKSIPHFKTLLQMNPSDTIAMEYLYLAYLGTGQEENAAICSNNFSESMKQRNHISKKIINQVGINVGLLSNSNIEDYQNYDFIGSKVAIAADAKLSGNVSILDLTSKWNLSDRFKMQVCGSYFNSRSLLIGQIDSTDTYYKFENNSPNYQGNLILTYLGKKDWKTQVGFAYFENEVPFIAFVPGDKSLITQKIIIKDTEFTDSTVSYSSYLFSLKIKKTGKYLQPSFQVSMANLYGQKQFQGGLNLDYYPFGNFNFYGTTAAYFLKNGEIGFPIFQQVIGFKLLRNTWLETSLMTGNLQNFNMDNGLLTFNTSDVIKLSIGADLIFRFRHLSLIPSYRYQLREYQTLVRTVPLPIKVNTSYINHIFNLSLKWNF